MGIRDWVICAKGIPIDKTPRSLCESTRSWLCMTDSNLVAPCPDLDETLPAFSHRTIGTFEVISASGLLRLGYSVDSRFSRSDKVDRDGLSAR